MNRKLSRSTLSTLAAGALASAVLVGCGSSSTKSTASSPTTAASSSQSTATSSSPSAGTASDAQYLKLPTKLPVTKPLPQTPPAGVKIAFLNSGVAITQSIFTGLQAAGKVLKWNVTDLTYNQANPASFSSAIQTALAGGDKYIILGSVPASAYAPQLKAIQNAGAQVVDFGSSNPAIPGVVQPVLGSATTEGVAKEATEALLVNAQAKKVTAHIGEVTIPIYASVFVPEHAGITTTLAAQCPQCTVAPIDISASDLAAGSFAPTIVSYLQAHKEINYLFFDADSLDAGLIAQLHSVGISRPGIFGVEPYPAELTAMAEGQEDAWGAYPAVVYGWIMADTAARLSVHANANIWTTSPQLVYVIDKSNVAAYEKNLNVPSGYQAMFSAMWKE